MIVLSKLRALSFILSLFLGTSTFGQLNKLEGLWITNNGEMLYISNLFSNGSYLFNKEKANANSFFQRSDTLSFSAMQLGYGNIFDTVWYENNYDLKLVTCNDSVLIALPVSRQSIEFFTNLDTIKFIKQEYKFDKSIKFEKLIYNISLDEHSPSLNVHIDSNKNIYLERRIYKTIYEEYPDYISSYVLDSFLTGQFEGILNDSIYCEFIQLIETCGLNTNVFCEDTLKEKVKSMYQYPYGELVIYHNNQRKTRTQSKTPEYLFDLINFLYALTSQILCTHDFMKGGYPLYS